MAEEFCLTCNQPDDGDRSLTRCPECGESWTTHHDRAMQHWITLALRLRWRSGGILIALVEPVWLRSIRALLESLPSPPRRGQGLCVTAGHRCEAPGAVQSQEHSSCKAQDQGVVPEQRPGQCFGVIAEQLASEEPYSAAVSEN